MQSQDGQKQDGQKNSKEVANVGRNQSRGGQQNAQNQDASKETKAGADSNKSVFGTLVDNLPAESREQISQLVSDSEGFFSKVGTYVRAQPLEVAGIAAVGLGAFWFLSSTEPGRNLFQMGRRMLEPRIDKWLSGAEQKVVQH